MPEPISSSSTSPVAKLFVLSGLAADRLIELKDDRTTIGRDDDNSVRFEDVSVSHHHAAIERVGEVYNLRDLSSVNGTFVNGRRAHEMVLRDADLIRFGGVDVRFDAPQPPADVLERTPVEETDAATAARRYGGAGTFKIVGSDGRVYGPVTAAVVRDWIAQGWVNGQTWVPFEKGRRWQRLNEFPEFAKELALQSPTGPLLGVPPEEFLWQGALKVAPTTEAVRSGISATGRGGGGGESIESVESTGPGVLWPLLVLLFAVGGWLIVARQLTWWPFTIDGPLRQYARDVDERIQNDPVFVAATAAQESPDTAALMEAAQTLVDRYPRSSMAHYILGVAYGRTNDFVAASGEFKQAVDLDAEFIDAWNNLGWAQTRRGNFADAVNAFQHTIKLNATDAQAWSNLGGALAGLGRDADAVEAYRKAIELDPEFSQAHYNLGISQAKQKNYREAIDSLRRAIQLKPDFPEAWYNLGVVMQMQGLDDGALIFYQQAVKLMPTYADAWGGLVKAYLKLGQQDKASEAADVIKHLDPAKAEALAQELRRIAPR